jgi:predicted DsbA family dithiol-disulfide isomerase
MACPVRITYYFETFSSWCHWVEPVWSELKTRYAGRVEFAWRIALMKPGAFPDSVAQCDWYYQRSGTHMHSPYMLNSGWVDLSPDNDYTAPNRVAEAARDFLEGDDERVRLALAHAALREGRRLGTISESVAVAAAAAGLPEGPLRSRADSAEVRARVTASTEEFNAHQIDQRPAFILTDDIGDKAVFSGLVRLEPLAATLDGMLADCARYASFSAHFGPPPAS